MQRDVVHVSLKLELAKQRRRRCARSTEKRRIRAAPISQHRRNLRDEALPRTRVREIFKAFHLIPRQSSDDVR